jgi:hypothetical protein
MFPITRRQKLEFDPCPFQGTQICAHLTYFFHRAECEGYMCDSKQL